MNRRSFLTETALAAVCCVTARRSACGAGTTESPNIILILTDDQGWTSVSYRSDPDRPDSMSDYLETPNMARAAEAGMRFTDGYAPNPICSPTRHSVVFGQNAARHIYGKDPDWYKSATEWLTIPKVLKKANSAYRAAHFGKWHVSILPEEAGFDYTDGPTSNSGGETVHGAYRDKDGAEESLQHYNEAHGIVPPKLNGSYSEFPVYYSDEDPKGAFGITRRAEAFMRESVQDGKPFLAHIAHFATHVDMVSTKETLEHFKSKPRGKKHDNPFYAAMLKDMDTAIGRVFDTVKELGIEKNTYIFIMGDNGGVQHFAQTAELANGSNDVVGTHETAVVWRNLPLRHGKHEYYEGGIRVPFLVVGPGIQAGCVCRVPVTGVDFLPTFAELAGHGENLPANIDGGSLVPVLRNAGRGEVKRNFDALVFHQAAKRIPISAIRKGDYKLVKHWLADNPGDVTSQYVGEKVLELYDLSEDLEELNDLSEKLPQITQSLHEKLLDFLRVANAETEYTRRKDVYNEMLDAHALGSSQTIMPKLEYVSPFRK